jgi:hypothetical protein
LESPSVWKDQIVCQGCHSRLSAAEPTEGAGASGILVAAGIGLAVLLLGGFIGWQAYSENQPDPSKVLRGYENRVTQLRLHEFSNDSVMQSARRDAGMDTINDPAHYDTSLTDAEKAELVELERRVAAMKADGVKD